MNPTSIRAPMHCTLAAAVHAKEGHFSHFSDGLKILGGDPLS
jgi:hypothetical protein